MSKSGQAATKADRGGQRVPKSADKSGANAKPSTQTAAPAKPDSAKKTSK